MPYLVRAFSPMNQEERFFWHRVGNRLLTILSNMLTNIDLTDMETGYKVMRIEFAKKIKINEKRFGIEPEIKAKLAKLEARIHEVPISYRGRTFAEGKKISWKDGFSAIRCIVKYNILAKETINEPILILKVELS